MCQRIVDTITAVRGKITRWIFDWIAVWIELLVSLVVVTENSKFQINFKKCR